MAQRVITVLTDDIDGGEADETVAFALDGTNYEIDLTTKNADKFRGLFQEYIAAGRKTGKGKTGGTKRQTDYDPKVVREWAQSKNLDVPGRGRIPATILQMWRDR